MSITFTSFEAEIDYYRKALKKITKCEGPFKMDQLAFAQSVIESMAEVAQNALDHKWEPEEE